MLLTVSKFQEEIVKLTSIITTNPVMFKNHTVLIAEVMKLMDKQAVLTLYSEQGRSAAVQVLNRLKMEIESVMTGGK